MPKLKGPCKATTRGLGLYGLACKSPKPCKKVLTGRAYVLFGAVAQKKLLSIGNVGDEAAPTVVWRPSGDLLAEAEPSKAVVTIRDVTGQVVAEIPWDDIGNVADSSFSPIIQVVEA